MGSIKATPVSISGDGAVTSCAVTGDPIKSIGNTMMIAAERIRIILFNSILIGSKRFYERVVIEHRSEMCLARRSD